MDLFSLRGTVVGECKEFATSRTPIFADDLRKQIDAIYTDQRQLMLREPSGRVP